MPRDLRQQKIALPFAAASYQQGPSWVSAGAAWEGGCVQTQAQQPASHNTARNASISAVIPKPPLIYQTRILLWEEFKLVSTKERRSIGFERPRVHCTDRRFWKEPAVESRLSWLQPQSRDGCRTSLLRENVGLQWSFLERSLPLCRFVPASTDLLYEQGPRGLGCPGLMWHLKPRLCWKLQAAQRSLCSKTWDPSLVRRAQGHPSPSSCEMPSTDL